jgi:hypothetical protein
VWGTDLGFMWDAGDGRCLVAFGDTYGAGWGGFGGGPPPADWRSNVLAFSRDRVPQDGLSFDGMVLDRPGHAAEILRSTKVDEEENTVIPTSGVSVGKRQILHCMSITRWPHLRPWITSHAGLAYSDDGGGTWVKSPTAIWRNDSYNRNPFQMAALVKEGPWVYFFGTPPGRQGAVHLARVPQKRVLQKGAHRYWNGTSFAATSDLQAQPIVPGPVSKLSVAYNSRFKRWIMMYLAPQRDAIVLRDAPTVMGPWTGEKIVQQGAPHPSIYGGFIHPWFNDRDEMYFALSDWGPYNVFWMRAGLAPAPATEAGNLLTDGDFEYDHEGLGAPWLLDGPPAGRDRGLKQSRSGINDQAHPPLEAVGFSALLACCYEAGTAVWLATAQLGRNQNISATTPETLCEEEPEKATTIVVAFSLQLDFRNAL